jgi:hypothetical protein
MDHLVLLVLAGASIGAWVHAMGRKRLPYGVRVAAAPVAILTLCVYFLIEALRTRGVWFSGEAEAGWPVIMAMGAGITAATGGFDRREVGRCA